MADRPALDAYLNVVRALPEPTFRKILAVGGDMFIPRMWDNEAERIGKQKCTPLGYELHGLSEQVGLIALLLLALAIFYLVFRYSSRTFEASLLWLLAVPIGLGLVSDWLYDYSWKLAARKNFHYDPRRREASWDEGGERRTYGSGAETE